MHDCFEQLIVLKTVVGVAGACYTALMEIRFTPEQERLLSQVASQMGTDIEHLVRDAALRLLEQDAQFRGAVRRGVEQADRGDFIEEEEMEARIERMLEP
jgi:predicted transcriptional regulator